VFLRGLGARSQSGMQLVISDDHAGSAEQGDPREGSRGRHRSDRDAIIRPVGAVLAEQNDEWTGSRGLQQQMRPLSHFGVKMARR
jgi:hypothetical protein